MAGRAGRRGMDAFGHVVVPYSPWIAFRDMLEVATGPLEPVRSAFAVRYNTVLHLWDPPHGERVRNMLQQSLAQFQTSQRIRLLEDDIIEIGGDIAGVPQGCLIGLDAGDELLDDYRNVNGTLTDRAAQRAAGQPELADIAAQGDRTALAGTGSPGAAARVPLRADRARRAPSRFRLGCLRRQGARRGRALPVRQIDQARQRVPPDRLPDRRQHRQGAGGADRTGRSDRRRGGTRARGGDASVSGRASSGLELPDLDEMAAGAPEREHRSRLRANCTLKAEARPTLGRRSTNCIASGRLTPATPVPRRQGAPRLPRSAIDQLEKERQALEEFLLRETEAEDARIRGVIRGIREILAPLRLSLPRLPDRRRPTCSPMSSTTTA